jgi:hypothetical protein
MTSLKKFFKLKFCHGMKFKGEGELGEMSFDLLNRYSRTGFMHC